MRRLLSLRQQKQGSPLLLLLLLLTGCGDDRPARERALGPPPGIRSAPATPQPRVLPEAAPVSAPDPLIGDSGGNATASDPLIQSDPMQGPAMPTLHSHWLRGNLRDAHVTVLLNGVREGSLSSVVDRDITMKLRKGVNSVVFQYQPNTSRSSAQMEIVESEHTPPIAPLVTFRSPLDTAGNRGPAKAISQTFMFVAN